MSEAALKNESTHEFSARPFPFFWVAAGVSVGLHLLGLLLIGLLKPVLVVVPPKPLEVVVVDVEPPKTEPVKVEAPIQPPPKMRVAKVEKPTPKPPPELKDAPPPPNDTPAPTPSKPVDLTSGLSMNSTSTAGDFAAQVGNTQYGATDTVAKDASQVKSYSAPKYTPAYQVDSQPAVINEFKAPYPEEAKRSSIEGTVVLRIVIDTQGDVVSVKIVKGLGFGLDEAARDALKKYKFRPATKGGEVVSTEINFNYIWIID